VRTGRGDRRGALRLGLLLGTLALVAWALTSHHAVSHREFIQFRHAISQALVNGCFVALSYLAVEPYVRRRWPAVLVSWSRVLAGRWRDPLVGRDALVGIATGAAVGLIAFVVLWLDNRTMDADSEVINSFLSTAAAAGEILLRTPLGAIAIALIVTVLMFVLRVLVRSTLLAAALLTLLPVAIFWPAGVAVVTVGVSTIIAYAVSLTRFGLVALVACVLTGRMLALLRAAIAWSPATGAFVLAIIIALTLGAAYLAMGRPRLMARAG
jgi:hypothetical protein